MLHFTWTWGLNCSCPKLVSFPSIVGRRPVEPLSWALLPHLPFSTTSGFTTTLFRAFQNGFQNSHPGVTAFVFLARGS